MNSLRFERRRKPWFKNDVYVGITEAINSFEDGGQMFPWPILIFHHTFLIPITDGEEFSTVATFPWLNAAK